MGEFTIETDRLVLRPFELSDADSYFKMTQDSNVQKYVPYACPKSFEEAKEYILKYYSKGDLKHDYYLVIKSKKNHQTVGAIIVTKDVNSEFDFCIMIDKEQRRKGYITEATKAFIKVLPSNSTLVWRIREDNIASLQAITKIQAIYQFDTATRIEEDGIGYRIFKCTI